MATDVSRRRISALAFDQVPAGAAVSASDPYRWLRKLSAGHASGAGCDRPDHSDIGSNLYRVIRSALADTLNSTISSAASDFNNNNNIDKNSIYNSSGNTSGSSSRADMTYGEGSISVGGLFVGASDMNLVNNGTDLNGSNGNGTLDMGEPLTMPEYIMVWVIAANLLVFLAGVLGNVLVILVVLCVREMKTATNLCLMNLSVADLLVLLVCQPSAMLEFVFEEKWLLGEAMCKLVIFLENTVTVASILIILTVSLERFWAVYYPLKTYSSGSKSRAMIIMGGVWITSAVVTIPFFVMAYTIQTTHIADNVIVDVCITPTPYTWHRAYIVARFIFIFAVPLVLLGVLYTMIIYKVLTETMECKQMTDSARSQSAQNRRQLVVMLVGIIVLFFVCLLPFRILALWQIFATYDIPMEMGAERYLNLVWFCRLLIYINSAGNPIIYNIFSTKFRRAFHKVLRLYCCCCKKRLAVTLGRHGNGTLSSQAGTRMTTMSQYTHYSMVKNDVSDSVDNV